MRGIRAGHTWRSGPVGMTVSCQHRSMGDVWPAFDIATCKTFFFIKHEGLIPVPSYIVSHMGIFQTKTQMWSFNLHS